MREVGLIDAWQRKIQGWIQCDAGMKEKPAKYSALTLENLAGPWIVLLVGFILLLLITFAIFFKIKFGSMVIDDRPKADSLQ